ncbi:hypothetical protein AVEN_7945-1 [Araneus ventricosus]|uniref:Uncharacterized protein n=1 Tax=Araneus ventricosus TaxID=182803 RepID=A0A4Y2D541_ARAVE|nr:hypothetical protein AVEN_7945-1 [Araneus ventricosus]
MPVLELNQSLNLTMVRLLNTQTSVADCSRRKAYLSNKGGNFFAVSKEEWTHGTVGTEKRHYIKKVWPKRQFLIPGVKNEENESLVASEKILLPPLHIKLGLMKDFVKAMDCGGSGFQYLRLKFPKVSETKIEEGVFVGPQFRQLMKDPVFESKLTKKEAAA